MGIIGHLFGIKETPMTIQNLERNLTNQEMAQTLFKIATLLKDRQDNPYRIQAYGGVLRADEHGREIG